VAAALVAWYPDRVRRVPRYVAQLSEAARGRIRQWPGFVRRAVEEYFQWAHPAGPAVPFERLGPLTPLVCPGCGYDILSARPVVELLAEPTVYSYCDRPMTLWAGGALTHSAIHAAGIPRIR
jgi:hypothetical protein